MSIALVFKHCGPGGINYKIDTLCLRFAKKVPVNDVIADITFVLNVTDAFGI